jgi:hypothetical protein
MQFIFLSLFDRKAMCPSISDGQGDHHFHEGNRNGPSCKNLSAAFPATIPMLAHLHSSQQQLFWEGMWICVGVCEYLIIKCSKTTVHEITDYSTNTTKPTAISLQANCNNRLTAAAGEDSANFCRYKVLRGQWNGSLQLLISVFYIGATTISSK